MREHWYKSQKVYRLNPQKEHRLEAQIEYALNRVIDQPRGASVGNHALLIVAMREVFDVNLNKKDAVEGALWCLGLEDEILNIYSDDSYIAELKQEYLERQKWADQADSQ